MDNDNDLEAEFGGMAWLNAFWRLGGIVGLGHGDPTLTLPLDLDAATPRAQRLAALMMLGMASVERRDAIRQAALLVFAGEACSLSKPKRPTP